MDENDKLDLIAAILAASPGMENRALVARFRAIRELLESEGLGDRKE
jgi:Trp operon repressor